MAETGAIRPTDGGQIVRDFEATGQRFIERGGEVAQHQGQGAYAVADVQQQLGGVQPPIGQYATLQQGGQIQASQQTQSLGMQLG